MRHRIARRLQRTQLLFIDRLESRCLLSASFDITGLTALRNDSAFSQITGQGVGIAVLDTGVDAQNPELTSQVEAFYNAVEDPVSGSSVSVANAVDNDGHGTHVSGIAASSNPAIGVAYGAKLVDIKVIADAGESQLGGDPLLRGLEWVAANYQTYNIKVVNMSLGESGVNDNSVTSADAQDAEAVEIKALQNLGITVVSASGNSYAQYVAPGESFPAIVSTIGVANTWADAGQASDFGVPYGESGDQYYAVDNSATPDTIASTSQRSSVSNQLAAPGEDIYSDWNGTLDSSNGSDLLHNTLSGTSMAAPFVSGVVALMQDAAKYFGGHYISSPSQILQILDSTADTVVDSNNPNNSRYNSQTGATTNLPETGLSFKRIDVLKAIEAVEQLETGGSVTIGPAPGPDTDNTTAKATPVNSIDGTTVYTFDGNIGNDGLVEVGANDVDLYQLNVVSTGQMTFTLSLPSGGTAFSGALRLYDSNGNLIAHADGTSSAYPTLVTSSALAIGTYYLGISSVGNESYTINGTGAAGGSSEGDYSLQIQLVNPDPNGTIQGAVSVDLTEPSESLQDPNTGAAYTDVLEGGELGSDPPATGSSTRITVSSDVDMFKVTAPDNGMLELTTLSDRFSGDLTFMEVFDSTGKSLATSSSSTSSIYDENDLNLAITAGDTYYVAVTVPANSGFNPTNPYLGRTADATPSNQNYELHLRFDNGDGDGTALDANNANIGQTINANIGTDNGVTVGADGSKDVDWYNYTASSNGLFDVTAQSTTSGFTPVITLWEYTNGGNSIVKVADTSSSSLFASPSSEFSPAAVTPPGGAGSAQLIDQVSAGDSFFVAISGQGNSNFNWYALASGNGGQTGNYTLTTQLQSLSNLTTLSDNSIDNGTPETISVGQTINGNIGADGALVVGPTDVDMYKLVAPATEMIDIRTNTSQEGSADTVLRVFGANGNQLASNDNINATTTASEVMISVTKGQTYYIGVDGAGTNSMSYNPLTGAGAGSGSTGGYSLSVAAVQPAFSISTPTAVSATTGGTIVFTVTLSQTLSASATVEYGTSDGSAIAGTDYTAENGMLTFAAGVTSQTISVPVLMNAAAPSGTRAFTLTLSSASTGTTISTATATGTIDDGTTVTPVVSVGTPPPVSAITGGTMVFTVSLSQAPTATVTVAYATADGTAVAGTDYTAETGTLTFNAGTVTQTVSVPVLANSSGSTGTLAFTLTLTTPAGATLGTAVATGTIDETTTAASTALPTLSVSTPSVIPAYSGGVLVFTVSLNQASASAVTVEFATADGTAVAGADYNTRAGTLTFAPGVLSQTVNVAVLANASAPAGPVSFTLGLSNPTGATLNVATALGTIQDGPATTLTFSAGHPAKYTDSADKRVELILTGPGSGTAVFAGGSADPSQISLDNTTLNSIFTVRTPAATLPDIVVTGSLRALDGSGVTLAGNLTVTLALAKLSLGSANGGADGSSISIGDNSAATAVTVGAVNNENLSSAGTIASLNVKSWLNSTGGPVTVSAASITNLMSHGDFAASVSAAALGTVRIDGSLTGGSWTIGGDAANLSVLGGVGSAWSGNFAGKLRTVHFGSDAGALTALAINSLTILGNLSDATLTLTGTGATLGTLIVDHTVSNSLITTAGNIGRVNVGAFQDSSLLAGVSSTVTGLPAALSDFTANDSIVSFTVRANAIPFSFSNSIIAAESIGRVLLGRVNPNNNGTPFGIAAGTLDSFINRGVLDWTSRDPVGLLVPDGDFVVQLVT